MHNFLLVIFSLILSGEIVTLSLLKEPKQTEKVLSESTEVLPTTSLTPVPTLPPTLPPLVSPEPLEEAETVLEPSPTVRPRTHSPRPTATPTKSPSPTPVSTPTKSPSPIPSASSSPTPSPIASPTQSPSQSSIPTFTSQQINEFINKYAAQYSVSPDVLRHVAICESGFNPKASYLSYAGLFQYGPTTWVNVRNKMGEDSNINLRYHAEEAVKTAAYHYPSGPSLWPNCWP